MAEYQGQPINLLIVEDSEDDALLLIRELKRGGYEPSSLRVDSSLDMRTALAEHDWDLIIADHNMPRFNSVEALKLAAEHDPNIPFIVVSGTIGEEVAVDAMKLGAHDYVMKDNLARLLPAIERELREAENRRDHQLAQERIHHLAFHDSLTGLVNRADFEHRLAAAVDSARYNSEHHALMYIDLDQFKLVNDSCGHLAGDELLRRLSRRLQDCIRDSDTLARLGGDEFGVLLNNCPLTRAQQIAHQLLDNIRDYLFIWGERSFKVGASIGLVRIDGDEAVAQLLSLADMACYAAKEKGRNRIHVHSKSDKELALRRGEMQWIQRLQTAMANNSLVLFSQPIKPLEAGIPHQELLLRMVEEDGSLVMPENFIPAAERFNLMPEIDRWVIQHACEQLKLQPIQGDSQALTFINLSANSLSDDSLIDFIHHQFKDHAINPHQIGFEITETAAIGDFDCALRLINRLHEIGCKVSLDDFGNGMNSFSYLKSLTVDFIKIDGSFVQTMLEDPIDESIVEAINNIGHKSGSLTIAESVDNASILNQLSAMGVDYAQGEIVAPAREFSILETAIAT